MTDLWMKGHELASRSEPFVVITLLSARGHAPQDPGAKAIVLRDGLSWGTVGGGKVEARAIDHARSLLNEGRRDPEVLVWNLQRDLGMSCGGEVTLLFEANFVRPWRVAVFGAGHVAQELVPLLAKLPCHVLCIDPRSEWLDRLPTEVQRRHTREPCMEVEAMDPATYFVVMTQGHATDVPILDAILKHHPRSPYYGVIGSKAKGLKIRSELLSRGHSTEWVQRLRCPMGLALGRNHPAEIAISIAAELLQVRDQTGSGSDLASFERL